MPLTDKQLRSLKPGKTRQRYPDGNGLIFEVSPTGAKVFRFSYRHGGKQRTLVIGPYPEVSLADARLKTADYKTALRTGADPKNYAIDGELCDDETEKPAATWASVARDYILLRKRSGAAPRTMTKLTRQVEVTIAALGERPVHEVSAQDVLSVVNPIAERGHIENAHEIRSRFSQIFRYAGARGLVEHDPAAMTIGAMIARRRGEFAGVTDATDVGKLVRSLKVYSKENLIVGSALLLSAYT